MGCKTRTMKNHGIKGKKKQSKLVKVMSIPVRILNKAANFYLKCMEDCAGGESVVLPVLSTAASGMPRSFNGGRVREASNDKEVKELVRLLSRRRSVSELELNVGHDKIEKQSDGVGITNYSVRVGKIGRIDEDGPCSFEDSLIRPRTKNHALFIGN